MVLFESPRRIVRLLGELADVLDDPEVAIGRELTKFHEEVLRGRASRLASELQARESLRGEFVVAVHCERPRADSDEGLEREAADLLDRGMSARDVAAHLRERGIARRRVYELARKMGSGPI